MLGVGVLIDILGGNEETVKAVQSSLNKKIKKVNVEGDSLFLYLENGEILQLWDNGQSCCESRYMTCDDDLSHFKGTTLLSIEIRDGGSGESEEVHDIEFLVVNTDKGSFTVANHNEHNGYYGGFSINARLL